MILLPGPPGWCEETEAEVLAKLNRNDKHLLRLSSELARAAAGRLFTKLLLVEDGSTGNFLPSVDLEASFPNATNITEYCAAANAEGWLERWTSFVVRNMRVLQRLEVLDISVFAGPVPALTASAVISTVCLARCRQLRELRAFRVPGSSWQMLPRLTQLTKLQLGFDKLQLGLCLALVAVAPQLQELRLEGTASIAAPEDLASLSSLAALHTLGLESLNITATILRALSGAAALTSLTLTPSWTTATATTGMVALGSLTQLQSLALNLSCLFGVMDPSPLTALRGLTSLLVEKDVEPAAIAATLGALPMLQRFASGLFNGCIAERALAGRQLESLVLSGVDLAAAPLRAPLRAKRLVLNVSDNCPGRSSRMGGSWFVWEGLTQLEVRLQVFSAFGPVQQLLVRELPRCTSLRALSLWLAGGPEVTMQLLTAVGALRQLQQLRLGGGLTVLAQPFLLAGCQQLQQLTLAGLGPVTAELVGRLVAMLPLLRLLRCPGGPSQAECQALLGQWQRHELQVDVADLDYSATRSQWQAVKWWDQWCQELPQK